MSLENFSPPARKPRADALRNRERIIEVAREAFAREGSEVTLEEIVERAGFGIGTLYRHFPNRDALIEAVYLSEVERLALAERELSASLAPLEALREWMLLFVSFMETKNAMRGAMSQMVGGVDAVYAVSGEMMRTAMDSLASRAVASGDIALDVEPVDLLRALSGVITTSAGPNALENARRFVDLLIAGIRVS